jgi:hypothetical protein
VGYIYIPNEMGYGVPLNIWIPSSMAGIFHDFSWWNWWLTWLDLCVPYLQTKIGTNSLKRCPKSFEFVKPFQRLIIDQGTRTQWSWNIQRRPFKTMDTWPFWDWIDMNLRCLFNHIHIYLCVCLSIYFLCVYTVCIYIIYNYTTYTCQMEDDNMSMAISGT